MEEIYSPIIYLIKPIGRYLDDNTLVSSLGGTNSSQRAKLIESIKEDISETYGLDATIGQAVQRSFSPFYYDPELKQMTLKDLLAIPQVASFIIGKVQSLESHEKLVLKQLLRPDEELSKKS